MLLEIVSWANLGALKSLSCVNKDLECATRPILWSRYTISNDTFQDAFETLPAHLANLTGILRRKCDFVEHLSIDLKHDFFPHAPRRNEPMVNTDSMCGILDEIHCLLQNPNDVGPHPVFPRLRSLCTEIDAPEPYRSMATHRILSTLCFPRLLAFTTNVAIDSIPQSFWNGCTNIATLDFVGHGLGRRIARTWQGTEAEPIPSFTPFPLHSLHTVTVADINETFYIRSNSSLSRLVIWRFLNPSDDSLTLLNNLTPSLPTLQQLCIHIPSNCGTGTSIPFYVHVLPHLTNLRVLHLRNWPIGDFLVPEEAEADRIIAISAVGALPLLVEMVWDTERAWLIYAFEAHQSVEGTFPCLLRAVFKYWDSPIPFGYVRPRTSRFRREDAKSLWVKKEEVGFGTSRWPWYGTRYGRD